MIKVLLSILLALSTALYTGCSSSKSVSKNITSYDYQINVLATSDLHCSIPDKLSKYIDFERKKDKDLTLVDAGDFFEPRGIDISGDIIKYFEKRDKNPDIHIKSPIASEMKKLNYDTVTLGNHEFLSNSKTQLEYMVSDFNNLGINVLSANTYYQNGTNFTKPYIIKEIKTPKGNVRLGILGLTVKEVGPKYYRNKEGKTVLAKSMELKDRETYQNKMYMNDLVKDASKYVKRMKRQNTDVIIAVVHSGEKPKHQIHPGNRIQDLATQVAGIDAIVAGHTHVKIKQHNYKNKIGKNVIVTQPGEYGKCITKINFKLKKENNKWKLVDKNSNLSTFDLEYLIKENRNTKHLISNIKNIDNEDKRVSLSKITPFGWDKAYIFAPKTPVDNIYKKVGCKWRNVSTTDDDRMSQVVFIKDNKPVSYLYGSLDDIKIGMYADKSEFKNNVLDIVAGKNDLFKVERQIHIKNLNKENTLILLNHMKSINK